MLFGEGQDDDIYGGTGNDRIYGGTGEDGILGDDGLILTSRNGLTEPLNGVDDRNAAGRSSSCPGPFTGAAIYITGELLKDRRRPAEPGLARAGGNDVIYGGLGDDFLHGGAGDDAISGAEARLREFYNDGSSHGRRHTNPLALRPGDDASSPLYDADNPWAKIHGFFLNFDAYVLDEATGQPIVVSGELVKIDDGRDRHLRRQRQRLARRRHRTATGSSAASATTCSSSTTTSTPTAARTTTPRTTTRASATATSPTAAPASTC